MNGSLAKQVGLACAFGLLIAGHAYATDIDGVWAKTQIVLVPEGRFIAQGAAGNAEDLAGPPLGSPKLLARASMEPCDAEICSKIFVKKGNELSIAQRGLLWQLAYH
jgi:hypothetical protein